MTDTAQSWTAAACFTVESPLPPRPVVSAGCSLDPGFRRSRQLEQSCATVSRFQRSWGDETVEPVELLLVALERGDVTEEDDRARRAVPDALAGDREMSRRAAVVDSEFGVLAGLAVAENLWMVATQLRQRPRGAHGCSTDVSVTAKQIPGVDCQCPHTPVPFIRVGRYSRAMAGTTGGDQTVGLWSVEETARLPPVGTDGVE